MGKQLHLVVSGQVQGVGFRYSAKQLADRLSLTGWVRNNPDGTVELVAQGQEATLQQFLQDLKQSHLGSYISNCESRWSEDKEEAKDQGFAIRR